MKQNIDLLREESAFAKFCNKNDKAFGCKKAFGCHISCPLWFAREVQWLVNEKGMTIGEAHRACLRKDLTENEGYAIIGEAVRNVLVGKKEYPEKK